MAAAINCFPVPLSPSIKTDASDGATRRIVSMICRSLASRPTMPNVSEVLFEVCEGVIVSTSQIFLQSPYTSILFQYSVWLAEKVRNPAHGSGRLIQILSTDNFLLQTVIPPTAVGGYFKLFLRRDLNHPPTAVGGIGIILSSWVERIFNHPPTAVGGMEGFLNQFSGR